MLWRSEHRFAIGDGHFDKSKYSIVDDPKRGQRLWYKQIEVIYRENDKCLLVEDLVTSGGSVMKITAILKQNNIDVTNIVIFVDREQRGKQNIVDAVFTITEIIEILVAEEKITSQIRDDVRNNKMISLYHFIMFFLEHIVCYFRHGSRCCRHSIDNQNNRQHLI
uniref:Phosphoribosyltransferase domain-containing protein n=1 Tax=viral metagenome TaxID=1070528 RepID=A0A6C0C7W8_9ZZZZ